MALFFWRLDSYSLFNITEARQAEIARQIWIRHDWVTPVYNGEPYFDKPILLHWLIAISFLIVGMNEWAVRLPSAIAAMLLILGTWLFIRRLKNQRIALLTATILAANPFIFTLARTGQHDMLFTLFIATALYCWYFTYSTGQRWGYLAFFGLLALAVLSKGPLALIFCGLTIGGFLSVVGGWRSHLARLPWGWGMLIFSGITLPWHGLMLRTHGWTFIREYFLFNNVSRFVTANLNQVGPWYYYLPLVLISFFPWIILLPGALIQAPWKHWSRRRYWLTRFSHKQFQEASRETNARTGSIPWSLAADHQLGLFMTIWVVVVVVFMSAASTKLPWYVMPGLPGLAYLCAQTWDQQVSHPNRGLKLALHGLGGLYSLLALGFVLFPHLFPAIPAIREIEATGVLWLWSATYLVAAIAINISAVHRQAMWAWGINLGAFTILALGVIHPFMPVLDHQVLGGRLLAIATILRQETCDNCTSDVSAALGVIEPSLNFYSRLSRIIRFKEPFQASQLEAQLQQPKRLLLVTTDTYLQQAKPDLGDRSPDFVANGFNLFIIPADYLSLD